LRELRHIQNIVRKVADWINAANTNKKRALKPILFPPLTTIRMAEITGMIAAAKK
jgi:hypothetical protein